MLDSHEELYDTSQRDQHGWHQTPSQPNTQGQRSQKSAHTQLAQGSQLDQYHNSASTTTSGQKTTDKSGRSSDKYSIGTQSTNGVRDHPNFSLVGPVEGGSQLPDTQPPEVASQQSQQASQLSQSSQQMAPPAPPQNHRQSSIKAILNNAEDPEAVSVQSRPRVILPEAHTLDSLHNKLARGSSGMSVEQMEQVMASLMNVVWAMRGNWNRSQVLVAVKEEFNNVAEDIEACQKILGPSQPKSD